MAKFKYEQLASLLKEQIDSLRWRVNERLPSIRVLAQTHSISKISVQKALHTLEARGVIYAKQRSGYYVASKKSSSKLIKRRTRIGKPKQVNVPDMFYEIMQKSAAFDIAPHEPDSNSTPNYLLMLNRHLSRALRQKAYRKALYYAEPAGNMELRAQICEHYRKRNLNVSVEDICITSGCQNSLFLALSSICQPGDIVAVESPGFYGVLQLLHQLGLKVIEIPCSYSQGMCEKDLRKVTDKWNIKACVLTPNFATPTGAYIATLERKKILQLADEKNIMIIEDDIYGDLGFHSRVDPLKALDISDNVILCGSLSKSLSRDLRIGWIIAGRSLNKIIHAKLVNQLSSSQAIQQGLTSFIGEGHYDRHLYQYRKTLLSQRDELIHCITQSWPLDAKFASPEGGLSIWLELPAGIDTLTLYSRAGEEGIIVTPGRLFSTANTYSNCLRLSFAHPARGHRLKALRRLGELLLEQSNKV